MLILRDLEIRTALRRHLLNRSPRPFRIFEELGIHNGNAVADIVAVYKDMHCFEIKGVTDNIRRIPRQAAYYNEAFPKITLVVTQNHIPWCEKNLPPFWGVMLACCNSELVTFKYVRAARRNPTFNKQKALMMLWRDELAYIASTVPDLVTKRSHTREEIAIQLSNVLKKDGALTSIKDALIKRAGAPTKQYK
jgi:hypothetical protein